MQSGQEDPRTTRGGERGEGLQLEGAGVDKCNQSCSMSSPPTAGQPSRHPSALWAMQREVGHELHTERSEALDSERRSMFGGRALKSSKAAIMVERGEARTHAGARHFTRDSSRQ